MKAVDTNVLARFITRDDPGQAAEADRIMSSPVFVSSTVLLETGWLLGSRFGFSNGAVAAALSALLDLDGVAVAHEDGIRWALDRHGRGGDLADMLHVANANGCESLVTFDRRITRRAGRNAPTPVETVL